MAHFAKIGFNNKVINVITVDNSKLLGADDLENEGNGQIHLERITGWDKSLWIQTSFNTKGGKYYNADGTLADDQSKAFRKNYAKIGDTWDEARQAFYGSKPYDSWTLNETTCQWEAPVTQPSNEYTEDGVTKYYALSWNEANSRWEGGKETESTVSVYWNTSTSSWTSI